MESMALSNVLRSKRSHQVVLRSHSLPAAVPRQVQPQSGEHVAYVNW